MSEETAKKKNSTPAVKQQNSVPAKLSVGPKNVWISISNRQRNGQEEEDTLLFDTAGSWFFDGGIGVLSYPESELTGLEGTQTSVTIMPNQVVVSREGLLHSQMVFREGQRNSVPYDTPYGQMILGIDTRSIRHSFNEQGGCMEIDYVTDLSHSLVARNRFRISVKEMEKKNG